MIDIYPTLSELAGLPAPAHLQGKSLAGLLDNPALEVHDAVYTCIKEDHLLTTSRWSYARYRDGSEESMITDKDPRQFFNLALRNRPMPRRSAICGRASMQGWLKLTNEPGKCSRYDSHRGNVEFETN